MAAALAGFTLHPRRRRGRMPDVASLCLVATTGIYGWLALTVVDDA
jgi:hypothetical protein